ncbi:D-alanyl-D-alanine carboxypeptidase [Candidatus Berkelbacteria bacterium]|nr:D-alanyl-D-alanine carboxypeptidase [Candidatus Berkelbacteria bacterium]
MRRILLNWSIVAALLLTVSVTGILRVLDHETVSASSTRATTQLIDRAEAPIASDVTLTQPPRRVSQQSPGVSAKAIYVLDVGSGYPLYANNEHAPVPIASTTKLMSAVVALNRYNLHDEVIVSQHAAETIGSDIHLVAGERITVLNLLQGLLIQSGNDAAFALAEQLGTDQFVAAMNETAAMLGMTDSTFADPAGLDDAGYASARDLAILAAYALRFDTIRTIVAKREATITSTNGTTSHTLKTSNRLINPESPFFLEAATGLKTGFTPAAGHCLVASAKVGNHEVVTVVLGTTEQTNEASAKASRSLLQWALNSYQWDD